MKFDANGAPVWEFNGEALLRCETDGSSYPNGGLVDALFTTQRLIHLDTAQHELSSGVSHH